MPKDSLLFGPYSSPGIKVGESVECFHRDRLVLVGAISDGRIQWPLAKKTGRKSLILCGDLVRAVRHESVQSPRVAAYHQPKPKGQDHDDDLQNSRTIYRFDAIGLRVHEYRRGDSKMQRAITIHQPRSKLGQGSRRASQQASRRKGYQDYFGRETVASPRCRAAPPAARRPGLSPGQFTRPLVRGTTGAKK